MPDGPLTPPDARRQKGVPDLIAEDVAGTDDGTHNLTARAVIGDRP